MGRVSYHDLRRRAPLAGALALLAAAAVVAPAAGPAPVRLAVAGCVVALALVQWTRDWRGLVIALAVWLILLGLSRRLLTEAASRVGADPLLLVAPVVLGLLVMSAVGGGALSRRSGLTTAVLALGGLTVLGSLNAGQAPLLAGVAGLLFVLVPQLAFWPGRVLPDEILRTVLRVFAMLALAVAGYGLWQTYAGLLPWDRRWVAESGYQALNVGGAIRAFGTSASAAEYASVLAIGIVCWLVLPVASRWVTAGAVALLGTALVLVSSRGPVVLLIAALVVVAAARFAVPGTTAVAVTAAAVVLIPVVASMLLPHTAAASATSPLIAHQVDGLANPFDAESSTLLGHAVLARDGLVSVVHHPFGQGIGVITLGVKFGGSPVHTEADLSNVAVAFGAVGVVAFLAVFCLGLARAYRTAIQTRAPLALAALGVLVVTTNQWLNGGMYAVAWLPWLLLGWLDRPPHTAGTEPRTAGTEGEGP